MNQSSVFKPTFSPLRIADTVAVVAPSFGAIEGLLEKARSFLSQWGLRIKVHSDLYGDDLLYANTDDKRLQCLIDAFYDEEVKAIWCLRGGAGAKRLIPFLEKLERPRHEKLFIGLSDITALHHFFHQAWGWTPIHGCTLTQLVKENANPAIIKEMQDVLFGTQSEVTFRDLIPLNLQAQELESVTASLVGGNLAVLQYSLGTDWQLQTSNKFLLLEDVNEKPYRIAEYLEHFKQARILKDLKALLLADFTYDHPEQDQSALLQEVFKKFATEVQFPIFRMTGVGHGSISRPFKIGGTAILNGQEQKLTCSFS
ncbi:MAG: LD-carboxypeptidase [Candidatus Paracaedimonas acanthamoebae]|uniref:LD-carboxypeptidase n=1 Tax=Candidatus Paracaedimonas acanthamoebae TaxID=244581 RepID=A0A8J7Q016_9PROT|nr:LD-carboxypeptidase [Candidatus Paracaedimonas acanthamoebae]